MSKNAVEQVIEAGLGQYGWQIFTSKGHEAEAERLTAAMRQSLAYFDELIESVPAAEAAGEAMVYWTKIAGEVRGYGSTDTEPRSVAAGIIATYALEYDDDIDAGDVYFY